MICAMHLRAQRIMHMINIFMNIVKINKNVNRTQLSLIVVKRKNQNRQHTKVHVTKPYSNDLVIDIHD